MALVIHGFSSRLLCRFRCFTHRDRGMSYNNQAQIIYYMDHACINITLIKPLKSIVAKS